MVEASQRVLEVHTAQVNNQVPYSMSKHKSPREGLGQKVIVHSEKSVKSYGGNKVDD